MKGLRTADGNPAAPPFTKGPYEMSESVVFQKPAVESYIRYVLEENFKKLPQINASMDDTYDNEAVRICNTDFEIQGTSIADNDVTFAATIGGIQLETNTGTNDQVIVLPHVDSNYTAWTGILWGTENQVIWEAVIRTGSSIATIVLMAGLRQSAVVDEGGDDDAAFFRFDTNVANWEATVSINTVDTVFDTGVVVEADTNYYFKIEIDSDRKAHFFIDNKEVYVSAALKNDENFVPTIGVQDTAGANKYLNIVKQKISRIIYE